jgi:antitoxin FitA
VLSQFGHDHKVPLAVPPGSGSRHLHRRGQLRGCCRCPGRDWFAGPAGAGLAVPTDVTGPQAAAALFEAVRQRWRRVGLLVNNALHRPMPTRPGRGARAGDSAVVLWRFWRHNGAMPSVQIKDVPEQTHAVLRQRAAAAHQSLQEYLRARLIEEASEPTLEEVLDRAGGRSGGSVPLKTAVSALGADRDRR